MITFSPHPIKEEISLGREKVAIPAAREIFP